MEKKLLVTRVAQALANSKFPERDALSALGLLAGSEMTPEYIATLWEMAVDAVEARVINIAKLVREYVDQADRYVTIDEALRYVMDHIEL